MSTGRQEHGRLRVLLTTPDFPPAVGGIQLVAGRLVEQARRTSWHVVAPQHPAAAAHDAATYPGTTVTRVPVGRSGDPLRFARLNGWTLRAAGRFRPHALLALHVVSAPAAVLAARALRVPCITYAHADEIPAHPALSRAVMRTTTSVVAVSRHTAQLVLDHGARPSIVETIPPGVDLPAQPPPLDRTGSVIVTVARLDDRYKGHDVVLEALPTVVRRVPDVRWIVIGEGRLRDELSRSASALGVGPHVDFTGRLSDAERDRWLSEAKLFVMPSRLPPGEGGEGFGIAFMEAAAHGLPVVAGDVAGARDAVEHGVTGVLVDPEDPRVVADEIVSLLTDEDRRLAMARAGTRRAQAFRWPAVVARVEELIESVVARR